ncbi:hypothetical protein CBR_g301 [Chara braunii]|uniref:Uncharacterized protein n=1 Tax=Chara braunii TaxID=69332 RepID=A0A388JQA5_CHABU|nr:hypothetical protein CBR_g301 [Chara braunii]|eukprot:GBG59970.1 hypothetical protein CBR_g301 [Chara braunii]
MSGGIADGTRKVLTIDDLVEALDRCERSQRNVPKVDTFHFNGKRVSDWLDLVEQALVGLSDAVKFQRIMKYVLHDHHQEVEKVVNAANGSWVEIQRWDAKEVDEGHDEPIGDSPREEVRQGEERGAQGGRVAEEVIEVGEDTPPQAHVAELRPEIVPKIAREEEEEPQQGEIPSLPPEVILSPGVKMEIERERTDWRRKAISMIDRYLAVHAQEHPDIEEPMPMEPPRESRQLEREAGAEIPGRADHRTRGRVPAGETADEKRARVGKCVEEIWQESQRLEVVRALPDQPPPPKPCGVKEMWDEFFDQHGEGLTTPEGAGLGTSRRLDEYLDRKIRFLTKTSFNRYLMLKDDLAGKKVKEASHGVRLKAVEAEVRELRALVASQAAIIQDLRRQPRDRVDRTEREEPAEVVDGAGSSRHDVQRESIQDLSEQPLAVGLPLEPPMGRVIMEPEEAKAKREAEREAFEFRAPTELATLPTTAVEPMTEAMPLSVERGQQTTSSEPIQGSVKGSMDVLLKAVDTMQEEASLFSPEQRVEEPPQGEMMIAMKSVIEGRPQRLDTPEYRPTGVGIRAEPSTREMDLRSKESMDVPQSYELGREASEAPSSLGSQRKKKRLRKS